MANIDNIDDATTVRELEVNDTAYDIVGKGVLDQNNRTTNLEWIGTKAEYEALGTYSDKCTYIITDDSADSQSDEVGAIAEEVNALKGYDYVVDWQMPTASNNYTWYRKYKSGWVEQGGWFLGTTNGAAKTITLPIEMIDTNYSGYGIVSCNNAGDSGNATSFRTTFIPTSTTQITLSQTNGWRTNWQVSGMAA